VARLADGVIVGSKIIQLMEKSDDFVELKRFVTSLRQAIDQHL
jgi:tryptophan synthase alpha subunit